MSPRRQTANYVRMRAETGRQDFAIWDGFSFVVVVVVFLFSFEQKNAKRRTHDEMSVSYMGDRQEKNPPHFES